MSVREEENVIEDVVDYTEEQMYNWYIKHSNKAGLTSIISAITNKQGTEKLTSISNKIKKMYEGDGIDGVELNENWNEFFRELDTLKAKNNIPPPEGINIKVPTIDERIDIYQKSPEYTDLFESIDDDFKSILDENYQKSAGNFEEKIIEFDDAPTIDFTKTEGLLEDLKPMEIVSGEDAVVVSNWSKFVNRGLGNDIKQAVYSRLESLGGETFISTSERGFFIGEEETVGTAVRSVSLEIISASRLSSLALTIGRSLAWGFLVGLAVWGAFELLEKMTGIDWSPILDKMLDPTLGDKFALQEISKGIRLGDKDTDKLIELQQANRYIRKLDELRKMINNVYLTYYRIVEKINFEPETKEIKFENYFKNHKNNLLWVKDKNLIKRFDDILVETENKYYGKTDSPTNYNDKWTITNRTKWENDVLTKINKLIEQDNYRIAEELKKRKEIIDSQDAQLINSLLFENAIPFNLVFWSLIWSIKAYTDPDTDLADKLLKGYAPFGEFDFETKPINGVMDFITEKIEDSFVPTFNNWISTTIAYSPHSNILFIAFRGTDYNQMFRYNPNGLLNFLHNLFLDFKTTTVPFEGINNHRFNIHSGFLEAFLTIKQKLLTRLRVLVDRYNPREVIFTGHSLGSAISKVCMIDKEISEYATAYIGFGSPRVSAGSHDKDVYRKRWGNRSLRINNSDDIISYLPLPLHGYRFLDKGLLIDRSDNYKTALLDGDYRYKKYSDYLDKIASMGGHNRINYLDSICYLVIRRPINIPKLNPDYPNILHSTNTREGLYLRACAYKAFIGISKLNKPKVVLNLLKFFNQFEKLDINKDGFISRDEYNHHFLRGSRLPQDDIVEFSMPPFDSLDFNGDNLISFKEFLNYGMQNITKGLNIVPTPVNPIITDIENLLMNIEKLVILPETNNLRNSFVEYLTIF